MESFVLVICIIMTVNTTVALLTGFKEVVATKEIRKLQVLSTLGLLIWGWLIYF